MGAGAIATIMWAFHFLSQTGLVPAFQPSEKGDLGALYESYASGQSVGQYGTVSGNRFPSTSTIGTIANGVSQVLQTGHLGSSVADPHAHPAYRNIPAHSASHGSQNIQPASYGANGYANPNGYSNTSAPYGNYAASGFPGAATPGDIRVFFSPSGGCTEAIVHQLQQAQRSIYVQAYSFTSEPIAHACVDAHRRGVQVLVLLDKSQETEPYSAADFLANHGIPTFIDAKHAIAHNKVMLIDGRTIVTGSFNFTANAERANAENLLIIRDRLDLYAAYEINLKHHFEHGTRHMPRTGQGNHGASYGASSLSRWAGAPR